MDCSLNNLEAIGDEPAPEVAMAIKRCLESLVRDARRSQLEDLAEFLALAALAAEDAAKARRKAAVTTSVASGLSTKADLAHRKVAGTC